MRRRLALALALLLALTPRMFGASGDTLLVLPVQASTSPSTNFAPFDVRNAHLVADFDATTDETIYFETVLPRHYAAGGVTVTIYWMASTATTGTARWEIAWERHDDEVTDLDADSFAATQSAGGTAPATLGAVQYTTIAFTNGAQMDSVTVGEKCRILLRRDANGTTGTDDMAGDAEVLAIEVKET